MNLKSNTKWNSRDLQNNLLIIPYTIVPPVSYLFAHRRSYHLFFHISIFKCNYLFHTSVFHRLFPYALSHIYLKLVDCLEKCLIYGHIRRFANWFYYSFTTFNGLSLDMQKAPAGCRIDRYTTLRGTSKRKNKITPPIRRRFSLLHRRTGTLLFYALMLRSKGKWSLDLCGS